MLDPQDRNLLLDALRPPAGYVLDHAIGTTFSLDLLALLTAPLAFTLFDGQDEAGQSDPLALLETMRQYADRITVFCQAGQIAVPKQHRLLYSYLEHSVCEVMPGGDGIFHPKVWVLRFHAPGEPAQYRLLCLSRNLTFDRSWDTILVLDGELTERTNAFRKNYALGEFIEALPSMALRGMPADTGKRLAQFAYEIRRVDFAPPDGLEVVRFWVLGLPHRRRLWPFQGRIDRLAVISPFIATNTLARLTATVNGENVLISRSESLAPLSAEELAGFKQVFTLNPLANPEETDEADSLVEDLPLDGLHAKLYVADAGWRARLWTGSANATSAAFRNNVEFLVELEGGRNYGVGALLADDENTACFRTLLKEVAFQQPAKPIDLARQHIDELLFGAREALARAKLEAHVVPIGQDRYRVSLRTAASREMLDGLPAFDVHTWPITLDESHAVSVACQSNPVAEIGPCSLEALTAFFAFRITVSVADHSQSTRFVLNLPLKGAPDGRRTHILRNILSDRKKVLRFLLLLLSDIYKDALEMLDAMETLREGRSTRVSDDGVNLPLFEALVRAAARNPGKLDQVAQLVEDLRRTPEGAALLPEDFDAIWEPIWTARQDYRA